MQPTWVEFQMKKSYPNFVSQFDALVDRDIRWMPYTLDEIHARAPQGLSSLWLRDQAYWMTRKPLVYDIHMEEYVVHRVMRQFYRYQILPLLVTHNMEAHVHR
jgi:hypothetical protein